MNNKFCTVILLLVGITINTLSGENGIISKSQKSKVITSDSTAKDVMDMAIMSITTDFLGNELPNNNYKKIGDWATIGM